MQENESSSSDSSDNEKEKQTNNKSWAESSSSNTSEEEEIEDSDVDKDNKKEEASGSGNSSDSDKDVEEDEKPPAIISPREKKIKDEKKIWEDNPDIYGIRRSSRARKEPQRLKIESESSDSDSDSPKRHKKKRGKKSDGWIPTLSDSASEESDSSFEAPVKRNQKKSRKQRQTTTSTRKPRLQQRGRPADYSSSDNEFKTSKGRKKRDAKPTTNSLRNTSNKISYKEDSDEETDSDDLVEQEETENAEPEEEVETIEKILRHRTGRTGEIGAQTTMYAAEADELAARGPVDPEKDETELQYLIKWKGWSNLHNTWESMLSLGAQKAKGMKKLENYIKRIEEIDNWKKSALAEDVDYFECQQEMTEEIQKQQQQVERIIAHTFPPGSSSSLPDYLCKWQGLPYSESTWEDGTLTARFFQNLIDEYLERERSDTIPNRNAKCLRVRPKFVPFKKQPNYLGSEELILRDYQLDGINWLAHAWCRETSVILSDEMGLGKTIQTISFLSYLFHAHHLYGPFLVVVPLSTMDAWQREFGLWGPAMNIIVYIGDVNSRSKIQEYEWCFKKSKKLKFNVVLTTYEMLLRDKELLGSLHWACLMVDEAHRLKNDDSLLYRILVDFRTNFRLLITGTPLQNSLKELWSLMHFIMPHKFDSWAEFEEQYSIQDKEGLQKLHRDLEPYLLRRVKKDVEKSLPAKVEQILRVEMSVIQKQYYKLILTKNVKELCRELKGSFSGLLNIIVELKKCCNHGNLIKPLDPTNQDPNILQTIIRGSGKMILLDKLLCRLKEKGHRVLIFSQMVRMLDIIADYLYLKRFQFQRLDGSIRGELRKRALAHFNAEGSQDFCFLLSTRAGGLGINLASADTVIIFDSDWNPQNDLQAMARAHRIGQKNQVNIYRFVTKSTIEEDIIERAKKKMVLDHLIIQRMDTTGRRILSKSKTTPSANTPFNKEELSSILKFGAEELFKDQDQEADQKLQAMDIDEILERAETQESNEDMNSVGEELLSQFKVVNYAAFNEEEIKPEPVNPIQKLWEEIIPEDERKKVEEELEKENKEEVLKPRSRKTVEKMDMGVAPTTHKRFKSKAIVDTDTSSSSESEDEVKSDVEADEKVKKTASKKPTKTTKDEVKGFTDNELRKFMKSYKKFARPSTRLDTIAEDAELTDKSGSDLLNLAEYLKKSCEQAVEEYQQKLLEDENFDGRKKGATLKIGGVSINAPSVLKAEVDLEPLAACLPSDAKEQKSYRLTVPTRSVHWGVTWGIVEDSMLLVGMLMYGFGNWEAIKNDQSLGLSTKILPVGNGKPQNKQLQSRADYLLKVLKEQMNQKDSKKEPKKKKAKIKNENAGTEVKQEKDSKKDNKKEKTKKKEKEQKEKTDKKKKAPSTVTLSQLDANVVIEDHREMEESVFVKCKEKLRPERKSIQLLQNSNEHASEQEQIKTTKRCLLNIGDHIEKCLDDFRNNEKELNQWRSDLWSFVARFTEFPPSKLYSLYRTACRKRDHQIEEEKKIKKLKSSHTTALHEIGKHVPPDRLELEEARKRALGMDLESPAKKFPKLERIKIPHKKKEQHHPNREQNSHHAYQSNPANRNYPYDNSRPRGGAPFKQYQRNRQYNNYHQQNPRHNYKHKRDYDQRYHEKRDYEPPRHQENYQSTHQMTYREYKEFQKNKNNIPPEEKHKSKINPSDEKPAYIKRDKLPSNDPRIKAKEQNKQDDEEIEPGEYISPTYSSNSASNSPHHYYGDNYSRKRTSSNNSDFSTSLKKVHVGDGNT